MTAITSLSRPDRLFIGGDWARPAADAMIEVFSPATLSHLASVAEASAADMDRAVAAGRRAFDDGPWPRLSPQERAGRIAGPSSQQYSAVAAAPLQRDRRRRFVDATLFTNVDNGRKIARKEVFGPVAVVIPYDDEDHAVRIANDSDYGLSGGVFTSDADRAHAMVRRIRTGNFTQNGRVIDFTLPYGGFKQSGIGGEGGVEGLTAFTELKSIFMLALPLALA